MTSLRQRYDLDYTTPPKTDMTPTASQPVGVSCVQEAAPVDHLDSYDDGDYESAESDCTVYTVPFGEVEHLFARPVYAGRSLPESEPQTLNTAPGCSLAEVAERIERDERAHRRGYEA